MNCIVLLLFAMTKNEKKPKTYRFVGVRFMRTCFGCSEFVQISRAVLVYFRSCFLYPYPSLGKKETYFIIPISMFDIAVLSCNFNYERVAYM
jgi:hypothetical protein